MESNKNLPIHRWYRIPEMMSRDIVKKLLNYTGKSILDPFAGVGTVLVEAKFANLRAVGIDINPFMCFASLVKTRNYDAFDIEVALERVFNSIDLSYIKMSSPPPLFNIEIYYDSGTLEKLLALKNSITKIRDRKIKDLLMLCFLNVAVNSANIKKSPAPRFAKKNKVPDVFGMFKRKVKEVLEDVRNLPMLGGEVDICLGDSRNLNFINESFDLVITSPPYCNNVDYVRHTQLELYWLGYAKKSEDLGKIRERSLTSCEAMAHTEKHNQCTLDDVYKVAENVGKLTKRALPRAILQYFAGMQLHFESIRGLLESNSKAFYVVGDSWIKGVYVPTHEFLAKIARMIGFKQVALQFLRYRKSPRRHGFELSEYLLTLSL
jgi:DNA modification methylase